MEKILIVSHGLEIGGAERALLGLLEAIDTERYEVDLFLLRHSGELMKYVPARIRLLPEISQYASLAIPIGSVIKKGQLSVAFGRTIGKYRAKISVKKMGLPEENGVGLEYSHKYTVNAMPDIQSDTMYDLAISFLTPHYFVARKVLARKKIAWIHTDYSNLAIDIESERKMWAAYDYISSISDACTEGFCKCFPELRSKIVDIPNIISSGFICKQAKELDVSDEMPDDGTVRILSIGRFCTAKNFDNVPWICKKILEAGISARWYLIGYGGSERLIREKIAAAAMEKNVIILGKKENPYPYIAACDLYVQPSRYEGNCVAVHEAQILGKPVVITKYATSSSQLEDGVDGIIVPMDNEGCAEGIAAVIRDGALQQKLIMNAKKMDYTKSNEVKKLDRLLEE